MNTAAQSSRSRVRRAPARADYDRATIDAVLDEGLVAHLGISVDGEPYVLPTLHARVGDVVYVHGSSASRLVRVLDAGAPACLTVTLLDGIVLARSAFHHSMNYRSVVVLGTARAVSGDAERTAALKAFTERLVPGRWKEVRPPSQQELKATQVLAMTLDEASAKVRTGPPIDEDEDHALDVWAGVVPLALTPGAPVPDAQLRAGLAPSAAVTGWSPARSEDGERSTVPAGCVPRADR
jgi:nitroimidazol reductase NimA-like FMN-containing flavoprotein (pyridoxamine 5'-phosphate oxidase superfamily)